MTQSPPKLNKRASGGFKLFCCIYNYNAVLKLFIIIYPFCFTKMVPSTIPPQLHFTHQFFTRDKHIKTTIVSKNGPPPSRKRQGG